MSIEKSEVKMGTAHEIGCRLDDVREGFQKEVSQWEGANTALVQAARSIEDLAKFVDKDIDAGVFGLDVGVLVKKYVTRSAAIAHNLAAQASNHVFISKGKVQAIEMAVGLVKKIHDEEERRIEGYKRATVEAVVAPVGGGQGVHPGSSIKERRLAEEAAQRAAPPAPTPPPAPLPVPPAPIVPAPKQRGARRKPPLNP